MSVQAARFAAAMLAVLTMGCAQNSGFDSNLKAMVGASERQLVTFMQRPPDRVIAQDPGVRVLQWGRDEVLRVPAGQGQIITGYGGAPLYVAAPAHNKRETCFIEWTIVKGIATQYRRDGDDCRPFNNRPGG